ncbi:MAG: putative Ig domain-containing protein, partial [Synergistaceae bacterium]|nr:putative Ig domain-containing protein [Synergistaceae bacterium]
PYVDSSSLTAPLITTSSLPAVSLDKDGNYHDYDYYLSAYGSQYLTWKIIDGFLPAGLYHEDGEIDGYPLSAGSSTFTVRVRNKAGSSTRTFTIVVPYITPKEPPIIKTTSLTGGTKGIPYGFQLTADGTAPITWLADDFPAGLALSSTGYISGTPSASGTFSLSFTASNDYGTDSRTLSLTVAEPPSGTKPSITTDTLDPATAGTAYSYQLGVSGTPPFTWTLKGKLPDGLSMSDSGLITGTPTKKGSKKFTITAKNDSGEEKKKLTLTVYELPEILTETLKDATLGKKYKQALKANGTKPLTWELDGNLPEGITFDAEKGKFSGTPTQTTTGAVNITLTNSAGSVSQTYTLKVSGTPPKIGLSKLKDGKYGKSYTAKLKVKGSDPITLTLVGELPEGLSFDSEEGTITGTPTEACTDREIRVIASNAADIVSKDYTLTIKAVAPKFQTKKLPDAVKGKEYSADIAVTGTPEITFSASGLPSGLTISNDGTISGTPTEFGKFKVSVTAANSAKTAKKNMKLVVLAAPELSGSGTLTSGTQGKSYKHKFSAEGSKTITFSIAGGSLPGGLSLNAKGKLSGKPKSAGTYTFTVKAANSAGEDSKDFTLTITASTSNKSAGTYTENGTAVDVKSYVDAESYNSGSYVDVERYSGEKYIVVAELPEVSADISGMYDFSVELDENAQAGEKLYWLANSEAPSADDDIAEFFDEDGLEIDSVPENRKVNISVWLNAGTTYKPVIAVKR